MKFERLHGWENKLNVCIRCGYCFEHCHLYKISRWETDTPRSKLIMLYGLMHGALEPTNYIANKVFECFNCKRCDESCSAGVTLTDIFKDARADFVDIGFDVDGTTSKTDDNICVRCGICVSVCKHEARSIDRVNKKMIIDRVKCQSCGCCEAACPTGAAYIRDGWEVSENELKHKVKTFLKEQNYDS
jgi:ferredoxin